MISGLSPPYSTVPIMSQINAECRKLHSFVSMYDEDKRKIYATIQEITLKNKDKIISEVQQHQGQCYAWKLLKTQLAADNDSSLHVLKELVNSILLHGQKIKTIVTPIADPPLIQKSNPKEATNSLYRPPEGYSFVDPFTKKIYSFSKDNWQRILARRDRETTYYRKAYEYLSNSPMVCVVEKTQNVYLLFNSEKHQEHIIGYGSYKKIYAALKIHPRPIEKVVTFILNRKNEIAIYKNLKSISGLPETYGFFLYTNKEEGQYVVIQKYYTLGHLGKLIPECTLTPIDKVSIIYQLSIGLQNLNKLGFHHRDLKGDNILAEYATPKEKSWHHGKVTVVITDFGSACRIENVKYLYQWKTTSYACSPELAHYYYKNSSLSKKYFDLDKDGYPTCKTPLNSKNPYLDVWSLGCIVYLIYYGEYPTWCLDTSLATLEALVDIHKKHEKIVQEGNESCLLFEKNEEIGDVMEAFLECTLELNAEKRTTIPKAIPFLKEYLDELTSSREKKVK